VLQTTNGHAAGGESRSGTKIPRPRGHAGSSPASGTTSSILQERLQPRPRVAGWARTIPPWSSARTGRVGTDRAGAGAGRG